MLTPNHLSTIRDLLEIEVDAMKQAITEAQAAIEEASQAITRYHEIIDAIDMTAASAG